MDEARYLAGPKEVAAVLGIQSNTVNVWRRRASGGLEFPKPIVALAGTNIWDIRDIIAWADATKRTVLQRDYTAPGWNPPQGQA